MYKNARTLTRVTWYSGGAHEASKPRRINEYRPRTVNPLACAIWAAFWLIVPLFCWGMLRILGQ